MSIHDTARSGFEADANRYARGRPDYPVEVDAWIRDDLRLGPGTTVLDVGAGTGKFTRRLVASGATVIALEPMRAMRGKLSTDLPHIAVLDANAEAIPLPVASVDAVVAAQAFHWFATPAAVAEMRRVLKPGRKLGLIWNMRDNSVDWVRNIFAFIDPYEGDVPRYHSGKWRDVFPAPGLSPISEKHFRNVHEGPVSTVLIDRLLSISFIASLPTTEREDLTRRLDAFIASEPQLAGKASVAVPYLTHAVTTERL